MFRQAGMVLALGSIFALGSAMPRPGLMARPSGSASAQAAPRAMTAASDPAISADGRFVAFTSDATNLVPGDTNDATDVFVRDRQTGTTRAGQRRAQAAPRAMGTATLRRRSRRTGASSPSSRMPATWCRATPTARATSSSATARRARPERVSVGLGRRPGRWRQPRPGDLGGRAVRRLHVGRHQPGAGRHQRRGRRVRPRPPDGHDPAGERQARRRPGQWRQQLRPGDLGGRALRRLRLGRHQPGAGRHQRADDVFVRDRQTGTTRRVSVGPGGAQGNGDSSFSPAISADGRFVAFDSCATNLVPGDTNGAADVFVRDRQTGTTRRVSVGRAASRATAQRRPGDLGGRALRRLRLGRHQPGAGRHQRRLTTLLRDRRSGHDRAGQRQLRRRPGQRRQLRPGDLGGRALRRLPFGGDNLVPGDTNAGLMTRIRQLGSIREVSAPIG